jgi:hypothetical protein
MLHVMLAYNLAPRDRQMMARYDTKPLGLPLPKLMNNSTIF